MSRQGIIWHSFVPNHLNQCSEKMETTIYEDQAKALVAEMKQLIEAKGINNGNALEEAGLSQEIVGRIFNGEQLPSLSEFLALCQISGISFQLPTVETPNTPM